MLAQVGQVDPRPDPAGEVGDRLAVHAPEAGVEGGRVVLGRLPEAQEPGQVPGLQVGLFGVEVEEEVEGVGGRRGLGAEVQVQPLGDQDVGPVDAPGQGRIKAWK